MNKLLPVLTFTIAITSVAFFSCTDQKTNSATDDTPGKGSDTMPLAHSNARAAYELVNIEKVIVKRDTQIRKKEMEYFIQDYDAQQRLRRTVVTNIPVTGGGHSIQITNIYDTANHLIVLDQLKDSLPLQQYFYLYDKAGHKIEEEGFGSGTLWIKKKYLYKGDSLVKIVSEH